MDLQNLPREIQCYLDKIIFKNDSLTSISLRIFFYLSRFNYQEAINVLAQDKIKENNQLIDILNKVLRLVPEERNDLIYSLEKPIRKILCHLPRKIYEQETNHINQPYGTLITTPEETELMNIFKLKAPYFEQFYKELEKNALGVLNYKHCNHSQCKKCDRNYKGFVDTLAKLRPIYLNCNQLEAWKQLISLIVGRYRKKKQLVALINSWEQEQMQTYNPSVSSK